MKPQRNTKLPGLLLLVLIALLPLGSSLAGNTQAGTALRKLAPASYHTQSGGSGGGSIGRLAIMDQSGTQNTPSTYLTFTTPGTQPYRGYRSYFLPADLPISSISLFTIKANYQGPAANDQTWTWYLFDWGAGSWTRIGNNAAATPGHWKLFSFGIPSPRRFINSLTREIRLQLRSSNANGNARLDYESIWLGYTATPTPTPTSVRFAVIGDYGANTADEAAVATLVKSWLPDFILTTGDNNYPAGESATIDQNIGQYYHQYIYPYLGSYGVGSPAAANRFFPTLGNHDWDSATLDKPYLDYFTLPGNERYYDFARGSVHFYILDSDPREPDGVDSVSTQANWLKSRLNVAAEPWRLVFMHHPPYSSSAVHGSTLYMQWDFQGWGASAVLAGHDHTYERLNVAGLPYLVDGLGGQEIYNFGTPVAGSLVRYNAQHGALLVNATAAQITFQFIAVDGTVVDSLSLP